MKKALVLLLILAFVGVMVFAEDAPAGIKIGGWGRTSFVVATGDDSSAGFTKVDSEPGWAGGSRVGFNVNGSSKNIGFNLNVDSNGGTLGVGDQAKIWAVMFDVVKLQVGKIQMDDLRGKIGDMGILSMGYTGGEDNIFARFYPNKGMTLSVTPIDGLFIGLALDTTTALDDNGKGPNSASAAFGAIQIGAGYNIKDIGHIRVQYIGGANKTTAKYVQAAFALTAVQGLLIDLGGKFNINSDVKQQSMVTLGATYGISGFNAWLRVGANFGETATTPSADATTLGVDLNLSYTIADPFTVGAAFAYQYAKNAGGIQLEPYVKLGYSNGYVLAGFRYSMNLSTSLPSGAAKGTWAIPIGAEYWF